MLDKVLLGPDMYHNQIYQIYIERCHFYLSTLNLMRRDVLFWFCDALHFECTCMVVGKRLRG